MVEPQLNDESLSHGESALAHFVDEHFSTDLMVDVNAIDIATYDKKIEQTRDEFLANQIREITTEKMVQSGELLDVNHDFYQELDTIHNRLFKGKPVYKLVSLATDISAYTSPVAEMVVLKVGLITGLNDFLEKKYHKSIKQDHVAMVWAHEGSHWDPDGKVFHLDETYCDTNAIKLCSEAGYNLDCALEVLEYLESIQIEQTEANGDFIPITHPSSEQRYILGLSMVNDPNIHWKGRYTPQSEFTDGVMESLFGLSAEWVNDQRQRSEISGRAEFETQVGKANTFEQLLEVCVGTERGLETADVKSFAETKEYRDYLLAFALYMELAKSRTILSEADFFCQYQAGLSDEPAIQVTLDREEISNFKVHEQSDNRDELILRILQGGYEDPFDVMLHPQNYPDFIDVNFDRFFQEMSENTTWFCDKHPAAADLFHLGELLVDDVSSVSNRARLLTNFKMGLSSAVLGLRMGHHVQSELGEDPITSYTDSGETMQDTYWEKLVSPVFNQLCQHRLLSINEIRDSLEARMAEIQICETPEVTSDLASLLIQVFSHRSLDEKTTNGFWSQAQRPASYVVDEMVTDDSLHHLMDMHLLAYDGQIRNMFGLKFGYYDFKRIYDSYFRNLQWSQNQPLLMAASMVEPAVEHESDFTLIARPQLLPAMFGRGYHPEDTVWSGLSGQESAQEETYVDFFTEVPYDYSPISIDLPTYDVEADLSLEDYRGELKPTFTDREVVKTWIWNHTHDAGAEVLNMMLNNPEIREDETFWLEILNEGINQNKLPLSQVREIVSRFKSSDIYEVLKPLIGDQPIEWHERNQFEKLKQMAIGSDLEQTVVFIKQGGYPYVHWEEITKHPRSMNPDDFEDYRDYFQWLPEEAVSAAREVLEYLDSPAVTQAVDLKESLRNVAHDWLRYGLGIVDIESELNMGVFESAGWFGSRFESFEDLYETLEQIPSGNVRNGLVLKIFESAAADEFMTPLTDELMLGLVKLLTPELLTSFDVEGFSVGSMFNHSAAAAKTANPSDIKDLMLFTADSRNIPGFRLICQSLMTILGTHDKTIEISEIGQQLDKITSILPTKSGIRDLILESWFEPILMNAERSQCLPESERDILDQNLNLLSTQQVRSRFARILAHSRLEETADFDDKLTIIIKYYPYLSSERDSLIINTVNESYTTWDQLKTAQDLILGHSYRTQEKASEIRSGATELMSWQIEKMRPEERGELLEFLIQPKLHVTDVDGVGKEYFGLVVRRNLIRVLTGKRKVLRGDEWHTQTGGKRLESVVTTVDNADLDYICEYLTQKFGRQYEEANQTIPLTASLKDVVDQLTGVDVLHLAMPYSVVEQINQQYVNGNVPLGANSVGTAFLASPSSDRRKITYRLGSGNWGIFEPGNYDKYGSKTLENIILLANESATEEGEWMNTNKATELVVGVLANLDLPARLEKISRFIDLLALNGKQPTQIELIKFGLMAYGVVGPKIGQTDELMPENILAELSVLKEEMPSIPKFTIAMEMIAEGRDQEYEGLGKILNSASVGVGVEAKKRGQQTCEVFVKAIRPDARKTFETEIAAVQGPIQRQLVGNKIDLEAILDELKLIINEELNPEVEAKNMQKMSECISARPSQKQWVKIPKLVHRGKTFLEMERIHGQSIRAMDLDSSLNQTSLTKVKQRFVREALHSMFVDGFFHADPHTGNQFTTEAGEAVLLDFGQVGEEADNVRRQALVKLTLGLTLNNPKLIGKALSAFEPSLNPEEIKVEMERSKNGSAQAVSRFITNHHLKGSLNRYIKAIVNILPLLKQLKTSQLISSFAPYVNLGTLM